MIKVIYIEQLDKEIKEFQKAISQSIDEYWEELKENFKGSKDIVIPPKSTRTIKAKIVSREKGQLPDITEEKPVIKLKMHETNNWFHIKYGLFNMVFVLEQFFESQGYEVGIEE